MALCKKCGQREQHTFPNGHTVSLCAVCGLEVLEKFLFTPEERGLTPCAADEPLCANCGLEPVYENDLCWNCLPG